MLKNKNHKIIGHRGAAGIKFENTLTSILEAIKAGVEYIEIDVQETSDHKIIVFHDAYMDRLTPKKGFVCEMTLNAIQSIKLNNGDSIPTLNDVIDLVKTHKAKLLVEVKSENIFIKTLTLLKEQLSFNDFIIGSFFHKQIMNIKKQNSLVQTAIMFENVPLSLDKYLNLINPDFVVVSIETFNQYLIDTVKSQKRKLIFYTVDTEAEIKLASKAKPYAIITNFPHDF